MMTLPLTPDMLEAAYNYLKVTPPFNRWKLPDTDDVSFKLSKSQKEFANYQWDGKNHTITVSILSVGHTATLLQYMAHEVIHMFLEEKGLESKTGGPDVHNLHFKKFALQVCGYHGFDPKAFY